jgi:hypothetical protein
LEKSGIPAWLIKEGGIVDDLLVYRIANENT